MVEDMISLTGLCGGSHKSSLLSLWVFLEGFIPSRLSGHILTFLITIPGCIWCYGLLCMV
jgi:hypothetical protein